MRRLFLPIIVILTIALCVAFAGDFWKSKKFSAWTDEEAKKMLEDSPWARQSNIKYTFTGRGGFGGPGGFGGGGGMGGGPPGGGMVNQMMPAQGGFGPLSPPRPEMKTPKATLRWQTALPIKQAIARLRYKDSVETSEEAAKVLNREESQHILGVMGVMLAPTVKLDELKAAATIKVGNLPPIQAMDVVKDVQGMQTNLFFAFPKSQAGAHKIAVEDKVVEFQLKAATVEVKARFFLKDMVYQDKLEI